MTKKPKIYYAVVDEYGLVGHEGIFLNLKQARHWKKRNEKIIKVKIVKVK
jgi:hypothetical protein